MRRLFFVQLIEKAGVVQLLEQSVIDDIFWLDLGNKRI